MRGLTFRLPLQRLAARLLLRKRVEKPERPMTAAERMVAGEIDRAVWGLTTEPPPRVFSGILQFVDPNDILQVACLTLHGSTLTLQLHEVHDYLRDAIKASDTSAYILTVKTMTRAEFDALGEFGGF